MQFHHSILAAAVLAVVSTSAFGQAATGAVGVRGKLVPNSCTVTIANGGAYNIGALRMADLNATNPTDRAPISNAVTLACSGGTLMALHVNDNQNGTALGTTSADFGLGNATTSGAPVGSYKLNIPAASVVVDSVAQPVIGSSDLTSWATTTATSYWPKTTSSDAKYRAFGPVGGPLSFSSASFALEVLRRSTRAPTCSSTRRRRSMAARPSKSTTSDSAPLPCATFISQHIRSESMKLFPSLLAVSVLAFAAGNAHASKADLQVTGSITPDACTMSLTNGGDVDLGVLDISTMNASAINTLVDQMVDVTIQCTAPVKFATTAAEDRPGTSYTVGNEYFGLNNAGNGAPIGHYTIKAGTGLADDVAATVIGSIDALSWSSSSGSANVEHGTGAKFTAVGSTVTGPAAATKASWKLTISPTIAPINTLALTGPQDIDGRMTLTVVYL